LSLYIFAILLMVNPIQPKLTSLRKCICNKCIWNVEG